MEGEVEAAKLVLGVKKRRHRGRKLKNIYIRENGEPMLMCELAVQQETGLIITLGLLCSPTHSPASL